MKGYLRSEIISLLCVSFTYETQLKWSSSLWSSMSASVVSWCWIGNGLLATTGAESATRLTYFLRSNPISRGDSSSFDLYDCTG